MKWSYCGLTCALVLSLAACGGGSGSGASGPGASVSATGSGSSALPDTPISKADASRFLHQASFGPNEASIDAVAVSGPLKWIVSQFDAPTSLYALGGDSAIDTAKLTDFCNGYAFQAPYNKDNCWDEYYSTAPLKRDFFRQAISGPDQLRQRMALALAQIFVISERSVNGTYGWRDYQNALRRDALGNFRTVLSDVALHPMMGMFLNMVDNDRDSPNENFARELLQLFSIGTCALNADGTLRGGSCQATYDNAMVRNYAFALTGWTFPAGGWNPYCSNGRCGTWQNPQFLQGSMVAVDAQHYSKTDLPLLSGLKVAAGANAQQAFNTVVDSLMQHPNLAPFIGRQLIQFFVTSNPSAAYVGRVSAAFESGKFGDIGTGQKGDLKATIAAVLMDPEARDATLAVTPGFGKLREPVLYMAGAIRALNGTSDGEPFGNYWWGSNMGEPIFSPPSVFNFYPPDYPLAGTALVGPQFGIENANTTQARINFANDVVYSWYDKGQTFKPGWYGPNATGIIGTTVSYGPWESAADNSAQLVDRLDLLFTGGITPPAQKQAIVDAMNTWQPADDSYLTTTTASWQSNYRRERVKTAAYLMLSSPFYQVQR